MMIVWDRKISPKLEKRANRQKVRRRKTKAGKQIQMKEQLVITKILVRKGNRNSQKMKQDHKQVALRMVDSRSM